MIRMWEAESFSLGEETIFSTPGDTVEGGFAVASPTSAFFSTADPSSAGAFSGVPFCPSFEPHPRATANAAINTAAKELFVIANLLLSTLGPYGPRPCVI
jgi:hypothetical protein